jgi:hypothetical protein
MRRSLLLAVLSALLLSGLGAGCGISSDDSTAFPSGAAPGSTAPEDAASDGSTSTDDPTADDTSSDDTSSDDTSSDDPTADDTGSDDSYAEGGSGDTDALCGHLKVIADNDLALSSTDVQDLEAVEEAMAETWPEVAAAYDEAIAIAPPALAEDLGAIKRLTELFVEALSGAGGEADGNAALDMFEDNQDEVLEAVEASLRAEDFTQEECGFSLNNE